MSTLHHHLKKRKSICRICGLRIPYSSRSFDKELFSSELKALYNVDVANDREEVEPTRICSPCKMRLFRFRKDQKVPPQLPSLFKFRVHNDTHCNVCEKKKPGIKVKCCKRPAECSDTESCESDTESPGPSIDNQEHSDKIVNVSVEPVFPNVLIDSLSPDRYF